MDTRRTVGLGSHSSAADTVAVMLASLWFGGHREVGETDSWIVGGVMSSTRVSLDPLAELRRPTKSEKVALAPTVRVWGQALSGTVNPIVRESSAPTMRSPRLKLDV